MEVGIIAPVSLLSKCCKTDIQYVIPSLLLSNKDYRAFYLKRADQDDLILLDSRKISWKREPEKLEIIKEALELLSQRTTPLLILPSFMFDIKKTLRVTLEYLEELKPKSVAGCLEGTNKEEVDQCSKEFRKMGVKTLAIPFHLYPFYKEAESNGPVLYLDNNLRIEELKGIEGTLVTSLPVRLGLKGRLMSDYLPCPPSLSFSEDGTVFYKVIDRNIRETIEYYENEQ